MVMNADAILTIGSCGLVILSFFAANGHTQRKIAIQKFVSLKGARKKIYLRWLHDDAPTNRLLQTIYRESYLLAAWKAFMVITVLVGLLAIFSGVFTDFYWHIPFVFLGIGAVHAFRSKIEDAIKIFDANSAEIKCD